MKVSMTSNTGKLQSLSPVNIVLFICWALTIHLLYLIINRIASLVLCLSVKETKCIVILASQKSLAVGIPIIGFLPLALGDQGLMVLPMIMSHLSIIIADSVIVTIWLKWFDVKEKEPNDESKDTLVQTGKDIVGKEDKETRSELGSYPEPVGDAAHEQLT